MEVRRTRLSPEILSSLAVQAAVLEAATPRKPGLVCVDTRGVHSDMDIRTRIAGTFSLHGYFRQAAECGRKHAQDAHDEVFRRLRPLGVKAEKDMFAATGGVNTHKGLIFSQGLMCAAAGRLEARGETANAAKLCAEASAFARGVVERDLASLERIAGKFAPAEQTWEAYLHTARQRVGRDLSAGETLYLRYGEAGIRGEAESGFPHALLALQRLWDESERGDFHQAVLHALLALTAEMRDTNILWRGGPERLRDVQDMARKVLESGGTRTHDGEAALTELQSYCLAHRLSPGGCADILCVAIFFYLLLTPIEAASL
jgi:triphosphoribosyl-dephospho-CoA synthetase